MKTYKVNDSENLCGIGSFKPKWLQWFKSPKVFLFLYTLLGIFSGAQYTYFVGIISTLEKRFSFDSKETAVVMMIGSLSPIVVSVIVGYYGNQVHRPRFMTGGMLVLSLSSILNALPYFLYGPAIATSTSVNITSSTYQLCSAKREDETCERTTLDSTIPALTILSICSFLCGVGGTVFNTAGYPYMDDNVKKKNSPLYMAASVCFRILGPTFGFFLSSVCLSYSEDPFNDPGIPTTDPRFIGAWWIGFIFLGSILVILSFPFMLFPRYLTDAAANVAVQEEKINAEEDESNTIKLKDMPKAFWNIMKNPIYFWHNLSMIIKCNAFVGYYIFMPKYLENQYQQSASSASLFSGAASALPLMFGTMFGGIITRKFKPSPRLLTGGLLLIQLIFVSPGIYVPIFLGCDNINLPATSPLENGLLNLTNNCNRDCNCNKETYEPICGPDGISTYFNPCYAGCRGYNETAKSVLLDCSCPNDDSLSSVNMTSGYCKTDCNYFDAYIIILAITDMFAAALFTTEAIILLRSVPPEDKSFSIGLADALFSLLCLIPSPLIFGALTDAACIVWEDKCGERGNCWLYDNDKFNKYLHIPFILFYGVGLVCQIPVFLYANRMKNLFDDEDDKTANEDLDLVANNVYFNRRSSRRLTHQLTHSDLPLQNKKPSVKSSKN